MQVASDHTSRLNFPVLNMNRKHSVFKAQFNLNTAVAEKLPMGDDAAQTKSYNVELSLLDWVFTGNTLFCFL